MSRIPLSENEVIALIGSTLIINEGHLIIGCQIILHQGRRRLVWRGGGNLKKKEKKDKNMKITSVAKCSRLTKAK